MDNTEDNVFVKIPESTLSVSTILSEVGKKTSLSPDELVLLDSKLILIADDKGQFGLKIIIYYTESKMEMFVVHVTYLEYTRKPVSGDVYTFKE